MHTQYLPGPADHFTRFAPHFHLYTLIAALLIALSGLFLSTAPVMAVPAAPGDVPLTQPGGVTIMARQWGDEWNHGFETLDGYTLVRDEKSGAWVYAGLDSRGQLTPVNSGRRLVAGTDRPDGLEKHLRPVRSFNGERTAKPAAASGAQLPQRAQNLGSQKLLVLLVQFENRPGTYDAAAFQDRFFGATNSVREYYSRASFNQFTFDPAAETHGAADDGLIGWLELPYDHPSDINASPMIVNDALAAADPYIDYASYDTNHDSYLSVDELNLILVIAGYEQALSHNSYPNMWAHSWALDNDETPYDPVLDAVHIAQGSHNGAYAVLGEIHANPLYPDDDHPATIGVIVHELGHNIAWPDLYDTEYTSAGVGSWSIMGGGSWNTSQSDQWMPGDSPAGPDAWLKWYQGWITPKTAQNGETISLRSAYNYPDALLLGDNPGGVDWEFEQHSGSGEYWLVENRQMEGHDAGLAGCGLLIYHIDESVIQTNDANANRDHPLMEVEQADGQWDLYFYNDSNDGDDGDPYPGVSGNTLFSPSTDPSSSFYSLEESHHRLSVLTTTCEAQMDVFYQSEADWPDTFIPSAMNTVSFVPIADKYSGTITENGVPASGVKIYLAFSDDDGATWDAQYASTFTDLNGRYAFDTLPASGAGRQIYVYYLNEEGDTTRLNTWRCNTISGSPEDSTSCSFNIADTPLYKPVDISSINLPYQFTWGKRTTRDDRYYIEMYDAFTLEGLGDLAAAGYTGSYTLTSLNGFIKNKPYLWSIRIQTPQGYGLAHFWNMVTIQ